MDVRPIRGTCDILPPLETLDGRTKYLNVIEKRVGACRLEADCTIHAEEGAIVDMVGLSFVHCPEDIYDLEDRLDALGGQHLGVVIKIENRAAVDRLPELLLAALRSPPVGVMVARGDLAVEVGFGRLAEVQEQILCLCEAAHVPVIWATQVLEGLVKTGKPPRPEVTDAAVSGRAEAVMLNKGPHVRDAVAFLDDVPAAMASHQRKKRSTLRRLEVAELGRTQDFSRPRVVDRDKGRT